MKNTFLSQGFAKLDQLIDRTEVEELRILYDGLLKDKKRTIGLRSDLGGGGDDGPVEKITQIMRPSRVEPSLLKSKAYANALNWAKALFGDDMEMDFDMLINKAPFTDTPTPWHQDAAYWIKMPDKRAVSCWIALDDVVEETGCMWFIPRKETPDIFQHYPSAKGGALQCDPETATAQCIPLNAGGCTFHDGFTLHFSKGNTTASQRRALIINFRPQEMIDLERAQGVDHTGERKVRNKK